MNEPKPTDEPGDDSLARYDRQMRFFPLGREGQRRLRQSSCLLIGCGALGSVQADILTRAGVGTIRIVDRDFVDPSNLQRQVLFDEQDVAAGIPKAVAAAHHLRRINSQVTVEPIVDDVYHANIRGFCAGVDLILDGTDNFETRFLVNDTAVALGIPWVYGGCLGAEGQSMTIIPGETPCLQCLMPDGPPPPGATATCDTAGILGSIIHVIAAIQACEAIKILAGRSAAINRKLIVVDAWQNTMRQLDLTGLTEQSSCPCCRDRQFAYSSGEKASRSVVLCGRNSVQISPLQPLALPLDQLEARLRSLGRVQRNEFLLRFFGDDFSITVFSNGRAIVTGTADMGRAKSLYAQFIGA